MLLCMCVNVFSDVLLTSDECYYNADDVLMCVLAFYFQVMCITLLCVNVYWCVTFR